MGMSVLLLAASLPGQRTQAELLELRDEKLAKPVFKQDSWHMGYTEAVQAAAIEGARENSSGKMSPYPECSSLEFDAVADRVAALLNDHQFVFLGSTHGGFKIHKFLLCLLSRPAFQERATDIVVEFANPVHQELMDRYLLGLEDVEEQALRRAWFDTAQPRLWARIPQVPEFFAAVRAINSRLEKGKRIRVLGGNEPVDWSQVEKAEDLSKYPFKTNWTAHLITEHLARDPLRRVLVVYGESHNHHEGGTLMADLEARMDRTQLCVVGAIRSLDASDVDPVASFGDPKVPFFIASRDFPRTNAVPGDLFYAKGKPLERFVDAVVYLGPEPDLAFEGALKLDEGEQEELTRRNNISFHRRAMELRLRNREKWFETHPRDVPKVR